MARLTTKCMTSLLNNHLHSHGFFIFGGDSLGFILVWSSLRELLQ